MNFRTKYMLGSFLVYLLSYSLIRFFLLLTYSDYFSTLSFGLIIQSFVDGLRFDISMIFTFAGILLFLMNLPVKSRIWIKTITVFNAVIYLIMIFILAGDLVYFDVVKRHLGDDLLLSINDIGFTVDFAFKQYWYLIIVIAVVFSLYIKFLFRYINKHYKFEPVKIFKEIALQIAFILLIIIGIRGSFGNKPINIINAFGGGSSQYGNLTLNGIFCAYHFSRSLGDESHEFMEYETAVKNAVDMIVEEDELVPNHEFPLCRQRTKFDALDSIKTPNIMVFLLESWTPEYIDSYSGEDYGVTPVFDSIAKQSVFFKNAYANGDRSIHGITATLIGVPQVIGLPYLGAGLEISNVPRIGEILNSKGYRTIFAQTSLQGSYRVNSISDALGFKEYYAMQDFPILYNYATDETPFFGWDYEALMFLEKKISEQTKPFFSLVFTGTTHEAYVLAAERFQKYPHERNGLNGFLNAQYYSDWAVGEFLKEASQKPWFDNTIFIFVADHVCKFVDDAIRPRYHIPLIFYAPKLLKPKVVDFYCSQADIPSTIFDILNLKERYAGVGKSLLRNYDYRFIMSRKGKEMVFIDSTGLINHNFESIISSEVNLELPTDSAEIVESLETKMYSIDQLLFNLFKNNKFYY